jgi:hypothetical protein
MARYVRAASYSSERTADRQTQHTDIRSNDVAQNCTCISDDRKLILQIQLEKSLHLLIMYVLTLSVSRVLSLL